MEYDSQDAIYLLGTGTPTPTKSRFVTAYFLQIDGDSILIDCGPATTQKLVRTNLWPTDIDYLFLTHHHFDHNADLPCFLLCRWDQSTGKENILKVFGPSPTEEIIQKLIGQDGAFAGDWKARVQAPVSQSVHANRGGSLPRPKPELKVQDVSGGVICEQEGWKVSAVRVHHVEPWLTSLAYRFDTSKRSIVFAGDTGPCETITEFSQEADVFVANCWNHQEIMDSDGEAPGQTGTLDAGRFGRDSGAGTLILTHTGPELCKPGSREKAIAGISEIYDGRVIFGEEGIKIDLWVK